MTPTRRSFLRTTLSAAAVASVARRGTADEDRRELYHRVDEVAEAPVLQVDELEKPVKIATMELLRNKRHFLVRVRSTDGAVGIAVPNAMHMIHNPLYEPVGSISVMRECRR